MGINRQNVQATALAAPSRHRDWFAAGARLVGRVETQVVIGLMILQLYGILVLKTGRPLRTLRQLRVLSRKQRRTLGEPTGPRLVRCRGRYYRDVYAPGWPSPAFTTFVTDELRRLELAGPNRAVSTVILKVTRRCPLNCEHCLDGPNHDGAMDPSGETLVETIRFLRRHGVAQVHLSGGEPLTRLDELLELVRSTEGRVEVRLLTSGVGLTIDAARRLKQAGLTGVHLSLDHWGAPRHDSFRGGTRVSRWVERASRNAREAGLLVVLSLCATRDFVTRENLDRYFAAATALGASFIQILEPKAVGCYAGKDVALSLDQRDLLESFADEMNASPRSGDPPVVIYPEARQRRVGCLAAGARYIYVDEHRRVFACPFSEASAGTLGDTPFLDLLDRLPGLRCAQCMSAPRL